MRKLNGLFYFLAFIIPFSLFGQEIHPSSAVNTHQKSGIFKIKALNKNEPIDQLLQRIDAAHLMLNQFDDKANSEFNTDNIIQKLPQIKNGLDLVSRVIAQKNKWIDVHNLQMYAVLLSDIELQLKSWKENLLSSNKALSLMNSDLKAFLATRDSVFHKMAIDSNFRGLINEELKGLGEKYGENEEAIRSSSLRINRLQATLSTLYYRTIELEDGIYDLNKAYWGKVSKKESPYFWEKNVNAKSSLGFLTLSTSLDGQKIILENYFDHNRSGYILILLLGILFFIWVRLNYRKTQILGNSLQEGVLKIQYLKPIPLVSTIILILNITPFLDLDTPTLYFELLQTLLILFLTYLFFIVWPRKYLGYWLGILCLYLGFSYIGFGFSFSGSNLLIILALNGLSIVLGILFYSAIRQDTFFSYFEKSVLLLFIVCNLISIGLNIFSLLSLAQQLSYAAIFGLVQVISLTTAFTILSEGLFLQAIRYRGKEEKGLIFEDHKIRKNLNWIFTLLIILFWLISFTDNLNIFSPIYEGVYSFLGVPRKIGSITFAYGNVILFFLIISISNFIQKFLSYFFGETYNLENQDFKRKGSRLAITRLLLLLGGFILAVFASGLPVDRITILIGALGVGIGLGLQSIVNNLVSGIILIFERPFRIGDLIEVGTRKGRIKEIGLRSSKLLTTEGSEVIIPNGDLLSERVVNWTLTNDFARLEFDFKINPNSNFELAKEIILKGLENNPLLLMDNKPEILIEEISETSLHFKVGVWINNINRESQFRSEFLGNLYSRFKENHIELAT